MTWRVLISAPYFIPVVQEYAAFFRDNDIKPVIADVNERLEEEDFIRYAADIDGALCGDDRITARVMDAAPRLKVIVKWGTGIDSYDQAAARDRGIRIFRTPNAFSEPLADTVMGHILAFARNAVPMDRQMKSGIWDKISGRAMDESTIGLVGLGDTGRAVARRAKAFGARLLASEIREIEPAVLAEYGVEIVPFERMLEEADYVSCHCDLNPTSHHLMNQAAFARMKRTACMINCSRGPVVDEPALVRALETGEIAGAALDVFEHEPLPAYSPLRRFDNVFLAPHNSNSSAKAWRNVHDNSLRMLVQGLKEAAGR